LSFSSISNATFKSNGWTQESKIPANYVHLVNADVDKSYLTHLGIIKEENVKPKTPKMCHICKMPNSPESDLCNKCGKPLDLKVALEIEEKDKEKHQMLEDRIARQEQATKTILEKLETLQKT